MGKLGGGWSFKQTHHSTKEKTSPPLHISDICKRNTMLLQTFTFFFFGRNYQKPLTAIPLVGRAGGTSGFFFFSITFQLKL